MELSNGYRFWDTKNGTPTRVIAILDKDGTLHLKDDRGSLEVWENWRFYVRDVTGKHPVKGNEDEIIHQLSDSLGPHQPINEAVKRRWVPDDFSGKEVNGIMATAAKKAPAPAKKAAKPNGKAAEAAELHPCICGCGTQVRKNFAPGHDSKVHSWEKKIAKGELKLGTLPAITQKYIKAHASA